jgi:F0F1-type ATP synthase epsilon subunit
MSSNTLSLQVIAPDRVLLSVDSARKVRVRLSDGGWLSVYPKHASLIAEVSVGPVQYETDVERDQIVVEGGILQVADGRVVVLTSGQLRDPSDGSPDKAATRKFDRLAQELMVALRASPGPSLSGVEGES